jgi:hypothetical protein
MSQEQRQRLEALKFVWDPLAADWEEGFSYLQRFHQRGGHCRVLWNYCDSATGFQLGQWVNVQRRAQATLSSERRQRLDALGFVWKVR